MDTTLKINKEQNGKELIVFVSGRLNMVTSIDLENTLQAEYKKIDQLILDLKELEYISSAGLRVVLSAYKQMHGNLVVKNLNASVKEVFEINGFVDILKIQ